MDHIVLCREVQASSPQQCHRDVLSPAPRHSLTAAHAALTARGRQSRRRWPTAACARWRSPAPRSRRAAAPRWACGAHGGGVGGGGVVGQHAAGPAPRSRRADAPAWRAGPWWVGARWGRRRAEQRGGCARRQSGPASKAQEQHPPPIPHPPPAEHHVVGQRRQVARVDLARAAQHKRLHAARQLAAGWRGVGGKEGAVGPLASGGEGGLQRWRARSTRLPGTRPAQPNPAAPQAARSRGARRAKRALGLACARLAAAVDRRRHHALKGGQAAQAVGRHEADHGPELVQVCSRGWW